MSSKVVKALKNNGFKVAAIDAGSIRVPISEIADMPYVDIIKKLKI